MGLDSYFECVQKRDNSVNLKSSDWYDCISYTGNEFQELKALADEEGTSFSSLLCRAVSNYLSECGSHETRNEVKYFRKFYFLNSYLKYDDDWYARDMVLSKDKCSELLSFTSNVIKECSAHISERDRLCAEMLNDYRTENIYSKTLELIDALNSIIKNTDWDCYDIVYNSDW